ncbi:MAG: hypothetical protein R8G66_22090 [Cytophagales bacterium]|nr:hypothetical protein [Cytophagales bacterium]
MKYFLLARPSALIVEKMKKLVESTGATPVPLNQLHDASNYRSDEIEAIVVSTALSSPVQESYTSVIDYCWKTIGKKPTFLATYADLRRTKLIANSKFKSYGLDVTLLGLEEAMRMDEELDKDPVFIITHDEIADPTSFPAALTALNTILRRHHAITS